MSATELEQRKRDAEQAILMLRARCIIALDEPWFRAWALRTFARLHTFEAKLNPSKDTP